MPTKTNTQIREELESYVHADALEQLLQRANRFKLLKPAEEIELAKRIERGDLLAKDRLINSNLRLVVSIAHVATKARKVGRIRNELAVKLEREPELHEIAAVAGMEVEEVEEIRAVDYTPTSLDMQLGDDSDSATLGDLRAADNEAPEEEVHRAILTETVVEALNALPEDERKVIALRFGTEGEERTRAQVGRELRMSPQKAEQIERRALDRLSRMDSLEALREAA